MPTHTLTLDQAAGQLLIVGFPGTPHVAPAHIQHALAKSHIGGVILFRRNIGEDITQVVSLNTSIHQSVDESLPVPLICIDQEGGRVVRLREPLTPIPPMRILGDHATADLVAQVSEVIADEIATLGFNVNFAPVLDVDTNPNNPVIGDRSFGHDPRKVAQYGGSFVLGHIMSGVIPCGKHFPGHGDTDTDSHLQLPTITHGSERLNAIELYPFVEVMRARIPMLMTAHVIASSIDPERPATLSKAVIHDLLRVKLGYDGVVVSDCLEMKAVGEHYTIEEMMELGVRAGVDMFLICHTADRWQRAHKHLMLVAKEDEAFQARIFESAERISMMKRTCLGSWPRPWAPEDDWASLLGCKAHLDILDTLRHRAQNEHFEAQGMDPTEA